MINRFKVDKGSDANTWIVIDLDNMITIQWQQGMFNTTQKVIPLNDIAPNVMVLARLMMEVGEWLAINHNEKL